MWRILAVNSVPLVLLVASLLYLGEYEDRLIASELASLQQEARIFASALGEGAVILGSRQRDTLSPELARSLVRRLFEASETRTRLFDRRGSLLADSQRLMGGARAVRVTPLAEPVLSGPVARLWQDLTAPLARYGAPASPYPAFPDPEPDHAKGFPEAQAALAGDDTTRVWQAAEGRLLTAAVPIQRYRQVLGVVLLARDDGAIAAAVAAVRIDILLLFLLSLFVTVLLSLYLSRSIAQPLRALALAAERVQRGEGREVLAGAAAIPDFSQRRDEVGQLSASLRQMTGVLAKRLAAIENFAADVAHELKNPLTSLRSAIETLERVSDAAPRQQLQALLADDVNRLDRLITDIASASRLDAELSRAPLEAVDIRVLLTTLYESYQSPLHDTPLLHRGARLALSLPGATAPLWVLGVESRLVQVLRNLLDNALSFSPAGGTVQIAVAAQAGQIIITVQDEGPGIPSNRLETIFDRFYSERPSGEKFGQHSGLGLSIARQIAVAHRGSLTASNIMHDAGRVKGACFTLTLPAATPS